MCGGVETEGDAAGRNQRKGEAREQGGTTQRFDDQARGGAFDGELRV